MKKILLTFTILGFLNAETLIHTSIYIDGVSDKEKRNASIVIGDDGRIKQIANGFLNVDGYNYYDLRDYSSARSYGYARSFRTRICFQSGT